MASGLDCDCCRPELRRAAEVDVYCCRPELRRAAEVASHRLTARLFTNPVDEFTNLSPGRMKSSGRSGKKSDGGIGETGSKSNVRHASGRLKKERAMCLDLPCIGDFLELDKKGADPESGFGLGLRRYINKQTGMPRAVLRIRKSGIPLDVTASDVRKQLETLCKLDHPNLLPFRECFEDKHYVYLAYDWCHGGLLLHNIWRYEGKLGEVHVAQMMREVLSALAAAHNFGVHHLDIGLFSIFLQSSDRLSPIKLFGIGLAGFLMPIVTARKHSRTNKHYYAAPELFLSKGKVVTPALKHQCDVWSVGVLLYTLISGRPPFGFGTMADIAIRVTDGDWEFGLEFGSHTQSLGDIVEAMMRIPACKRPTAHSLLTHQWLSTAQTMQIKGLAVSQLALQQLNEFAHMDHVKQTVARLLADIGIAEDVYNDLEQKFRELDLNDDGTITLAELMQVASTLPGMTGESLDTIVGKLDRNGNCNVDISEFIAALVMYQEEADERLIKMAFRKMDKNGDARVTKKELLGTLRQYSKTIERKEVSTFVGDADTDYDGKMDFREFMGLFPQVKDRNAKINKRICDSHMCLENGPKCVRDFKEALEAWIVKLEKHRNKLELACGEQEPSRKHMETNYCYSKGHFSELDIQVMIGQVLNDIRHVPGYVFNKKTKTTRKTQAAQLRERAKEVKVKVMGLPILAHRVAAKSGATAHLQGHQAYDIDKDISGSDSDGGEAANKLKNVLERVSAVNFWSAQVMADREKREANAECRTEMQVYDCLYFLVKAKSSYQWQLPLIEMLDDLREACMEQIIEVNITRRSEVSKLVANLTNQYVTVHSSELGDPIVKVPASCRMLPLGSLADQNLKTPLVMEAMVHMILPVQFVFAFTKEEITHQKIETMQRFYLRKISFAAKFLKDIVESLTELFADVEEDLKMSGTLEGSMPGPPNMSHLYLPHCEGRELGSDAHTPRSNEAVDSEGDSYVSDSVILKDTSSASLGRSASDLHMSGQLSSAHGIKKAGNRISRSHVLSRVPQLHKTAGHQPQH